MILALQPVDPRSLMQGDYMILRFALERNIDNALSAQAGLRENAASDEEDADQENDPKQVRQIPSAPQKAIVRLNPSGEAVFVELDSGRPLTEGEHLLAFNSRSGKSTRIGAGAFFFQEGHGEAYDQARFAEMRVDSQGKSLITHLLDENKNRIDPRKEEPSI